MKRNYQMSDRFRTAFFIILSGGFQDAYTYIGRGGVYANAQTGNVILFSTHLFEGNFITAVKFLVPIIFFSLGIFIAEVVHIKLKNYERIHWRQLILMAEIVMLFWVAYIPEDLNILANAVVSFVCAMQVQTFRKVRGQAYASTMCIGNLRSGTEALCAYFRFKDKEILKKALTYFAVIGVFAVGAGIGSLVTRSLGLKTIWVCCVLLSISFMMMFVSEERELKKLIKKDIEKEIEKNK